MGRLLGIDMPLALAEFLYSAILWGSLSSWLLWKALRRWRNTWSYFLLGGPFLWLSLHTLIAWYGFFFPPMGRVLDDSPDRPMAGERVIATWITYPMGLWTSYCSGRQVHLTDSDGEFAFRFAPWPTLIWGAMMRGVNARVYGRKTERTLDFFWHWPRGDRMAQRLTPETPIADQSPNTECRVELFSQQTASYLVMPDESPSFLRLYEEFCLERQPWATNGFVLRDLVHSQYGTGQVKAFSNEQGTMFRRLAGSRRPTAVPPEWQTEYCDHFRSTYDDALKRYPAPRGAP